MTKNDTPWSASEVFLYLLIAKVREPFFYRALEIQGYRVVEDTASLAI